MKWVIGLFLILTAASGLQLLHDLFVLGWVLDPGSAAIASHVFKVVRIAMGGAGPVAVLAFLVWIYRTNANLHAAKVPHLEFTPGWAVGWFLVPFFNLWKPYKVMSELWRRSAGLQGHTPAWHPLVGWWYWVFLSLVLVSLVSGMQGAVPDIKSMRAFLSLWNGGQCALFILTIVFVRRVTAMQLSARPQGVR